jgi:tetratricopeptide (TPR) repeat protein
LGASLDAVDSYRSALEKTAGLKGSEDEDGLHSIHELLGDVYLENLSRHEKALDHYTSFLALAESEADVARGERKVATIHLLSGNLTDAQQHFEAALAHLSALPPTAEASRVHSGLAYLFISRNQLDEADEQASAGLKLSCQIADTRGLADANKIKATIALQRGALEEARKYDERSLALYRQLGDLPRSAQACNNLGDTYRLLGQMGRATECLREGLKLARLVGDTRDEALLLQTTAELALDQGEWETAITHFEEALRLAEESGVVARVIDVHRSLGSAYERAGQLENARRHLEIAEISSLDTQHLRFVPWIYLDLACLNVSERAFGEAQRYIELAAQAAGPEPSDVFGGLWHRCFGYLQGCRGNGVDAVHHLEESLRLLEGAKLPAEVGKTRLELGVAYASRGRKSDRGRACEQLLMALSVFQQLEAQGYVAQVKGQLQKLGCRS